MNFTGAAEREKNSVIVLNGASFTSAFWCYRGDEEFSMGTILKKGEQEGAAFRNPGLDEPGMNSKTKLNSLMLSFSLTHRNIWMGLLSLQSK